jgi:hypothetical protein
MSGDPQVIFCHVECSPRALVVDTAFQTIGSQRLSLTCPIPSQRTQSHAQTPNRAAADSGRHAQSGNERPQMASRMHPFTRSKCTSCMHFSSKKISTRLLLAHPSLCNACTHANGRNGRLQLSLSCAQPPLTRWACAPNSSSCHTNFRLEIPGYQQQQLLLSFLFNVLTLQKLPKQFYHLG